MQVTTCAQCGATFEGRHKRAKYCSKPCVYKAERDRQAATGYQARYRSRPDIAAKRKAYGAPRAREYRQEAKVTATCIICGGTWQADVKARTRPVKYCSTPCRVFGMYGPQSTPVPSAHPIRSTPVPKDHQCRRDERPRFLVGRCPHCGDWYTADRLAFSSHADRTCSKRCAKRMAKAKRRATEREAFVSPVNRFEIFERDDWMCMLCGDPIERHEASPHPLSPSIDHVIPLARGGEHSMANVQAAHFLCNSLKGAPLERQGVS